MKLNKWTLGLATLGVVSLASAVKAEEKANSLMTALSATSISGYVDTSAQWNFGTGNANNPPYRFGGASKADGFNLNVVQLRIEKPLDESEWAAGYRVDLWAGPDANALHTQSGFQPGSDFAIRQAYVALRMPVGNGLDWKVGVFDSIIGYESIEGPNNPNYTRSYGNTIEPTTHTGVLASYRFSDLISASVGIANTMNPSINSRAQQGSVDDVLFGAGPGANAKAESYKTYMGSLAITAPDTMGFLSGSTLYGGVVNGFDNSVLGSGTGLPHLNAYVGLTMATPVTGLRLGTAVDIMDVRTEFEGTKADGEIWTVAGYLSYQATEKLSLHGRAEYADGNVHDPVALRTKAKIFAFTATAQYDLWKNVLSRLELRWDHSCTADQLFGGDVAGAPTRYNAWMLAANVIYKF